jgi:hypothetical protein
VAKPLASTLTTAGDDADQPKLPIWLVISVVLWNAWATNWCVCAIEKQGSVTGSMVTLVIDGCTATVTGPLVTPPAVAVMIAVPLMGFPCASEPLQITNAVSHTPAQTLPAGEIVAIWVFDELKVNVVETLALEESTADALSAMTSPATMESEVELILTDAIALFFDFEPPQPAANDTNKIRAIPVKSG